MGIRSEYKDLDRYKIYLKSEIGDKFIAPNFKGREYACKDGTDFVMVHEMLLMIVQEVRWHFNSPTTINSGYRTPSWNKKVGGKPLSYHQAGMAADIVVKGHTTKEVAEYLDKHMENWGGVIRYTNFVHVDTREKKYRKGV